MTYRIVVVALFLCWPAATASAQSFAADFHWGIARWSEKYRDRPHERGPLSDYGIGGRLSWRPSPVFSADADVTFYLEVFNDGRKTLPFRQPVIEGLFGTTVGPPLGRFRPFVKASLRFLNQSSLPTHDCSADFQPPPVTCLLYLGGTLPAFEYGGGLEVWGSHGQLFRVDVSERILKYPGPSYTRADELKEDGFFGQALRFTAGLGFAF